MEMKNTFRQIIIGAVFVSYLYNVMDPITKKIWRRKMAFVDRQGSNLNRKKLKVVSETIENGQKVITVDVERADSATSNGTKLNAQSLTDAIKEIIRSETSSNSSTTTVTQCECDYSNNVATTAFVWDVITALGLDKITHNHSNYTSSSGSSGSSSDSSGT